MSMHTSPPLKTSWGLEKHGSIVFTHEVFTEFQQELLDDREHCLVESITQDDEVKTATIVDASTKTRIVSWNITNMVASCSCLLFERRGVPCRHLIKNCQADRTPKSLRTQKVHKKIARWMLSLMRMAFCWGKLLAAQWRFTKNGF